MKLLNIKAILIIPFLSLSNLAQANSNFLGSQVSMDIRSPDINTIIEPIGITTVDQSIEFPSISYWYENGIYMGPSWSSNIEANQISITELASSNSIGVGASFYGFLFQFTGAPNITNVEINPSSTLSVTSLVFTSNTIGINYNNKIIYGPVTTILDVTFTAVPIPSSLWLFFSSLFGFGLLKNQSRKSNYG